MTTPEKLGDDIKCSKISAITVLEENNENETFFSPNTWIQAYHVTQSKINKKKTTCMHTIT